ncbi:hypothetical protein Rrhod_1937 [Rhodococcus rhodnii LMG 5362]|uniref:Uncharacterized protein n=1 Tax=Rhodococcus rhodnii LMG 5362 TaxID=1273125 RepID=R7WN32_9NOCA|nr:hypothetical protein Rrhod_1937 [Rhodococcus rhodnii LMG 5362]
MPLLGRRDGGDRLGRIVRPVADGLFGRLPGALVGRVCAVVTHGIGAAVTSGRTADRGRFVVGAVAPSSIVRHDVYLTDELAFLPP